ncbi:hypothetical protein [Pedobacter sp. B4-66]|uniref:hypothetical protein n=1 Tax=Pedobacter sp. B4-66 TaxID=2817280 RepID=UPI001BD9792C|nr:hypothetical protein [Pedobacter sp. B4-66]
MKRLATTLLLLLSFSVVFGQSLEVKYHQLVLDFIDCIKSKKKEKLADKVQFPLMRKYPLPEIKNKQEFLKRYNEVFDEHLVKLIVNSKPNIDWSAVGWRGIMLGSGDLWLNYDGRLLAVNYESKAEKKQRLQLIKMEKNSLHPSIKTFKEPIQILETPQYRIRIDDMGAYNYRYTSWPLKSKMSDKPSLIIEKGIIIPEGSGGSVRFEFKNGEFTYDCAILVDPEPGGAPALLTISKGDKKILFQKAKITRLRLLKL